MRGKLNGLWIFAKVSGLFLGIQMMTGVDASEEGILTTMLEGITSIFGEFDPFAVIITTIVFPIVNLLTIVHHAKTAYKHKARGVGVSCGGFFGMLTISIGALGGASGLSIIGVLIMIGTIFVANYKINE